jgi:hypothetical protein
MTREQVRMRAEALLLDFKEDDMEPEDALNLINIVLFTLVITMAKDASDAHEAIDAIEAVLRHAINKSDPRHFGGLAAGKVRINRNGP